MEFGLGFDKMLVILVIALFLVGPEKLPHYAEGLAKLIKRGRDIARGAKDRVNEEIGTEFSDEDWRKLDPRQYDPRRIIRDALLDDPTEVQTAPAATQILTAPPIAAKLAPGALPPFDDEAT